MVCDDYGERDGWAHDEEVSHAEMIMHEVVFLR